MTALARRLYKSFASTKGLLLIVTAWETLLVALLSPLSGSGPLSGLELAARLGLGEMGRVGRIIMLYHALAVPFVAALTYLILDLWPLEDRFPRIIRPTITAGYLLTSVGGLGFAYLGGSWVAHGLLLVGLSLVFYAGVLLCISLFPWRRGTSFSVERLALWLTVLYTLISATIGGTAGAYFGNGFDAFLAESALRQEHVLGQRAIIAHLHIMLTLIDITLLLIIARTFGLRGRLQRTTMWLTIVGATVVSLSTWSVMVWDEAHKVINIGSAFLLLPAFIVAFYGLARLIHERAPSRSGLGAILRDPVRFGLLFELLFVNVVVTTPGVYVAMNLETYRQPAFLEVERTIAVGHWHVLATLSAVIALLLVMDRLQVRGWLRLLVGWSVLVGSTLAFVMAQFYMFHQPGQEVTWPLPFLDVGIAVFLLALAVFVGVAVGRLYDRRKYE